MALGFLRGNFKCTLELVKFEVLVGHPNVGVQEEIVCVDLKPGGGGEGQKVQI